MSFDYLAWLLREEGEGRGRGGKAGRWGKQEDMREKTKRKKMRVGGGLTWRKQEEEEQSSKQAIIKEVEASAPVSATKKKKEERRRWKEGGNGKGCSGTVPPTPKNYPLPPQLPSTINPRNSKRPEMNSQLSHTLKSSNRQQIGAPKRSFVRFVGMRSLFVSIRRWLETFQGHFSKTFWDALWNICSPSAFSLFFFYAVLNYDYCS